MSFRYSWLSIVQAIYENTCSRALRNRDRFKILSQQVLGAIYEKTCSYALRNRWIQDLKSTSFSYSWLFIVQPMKTHVDTLSNRDGFKILSRWVLVTLWLFIVQAMKTHVHMPLHVFISMLSWLTHAFCRVGAIFGQLNIEVCFNTSEQIV